MNRGMMQRSSLLMGVLLCLALALVVPVVAQEDGEEQEEATPVPTVMTEVTPPPPLPSPSPSPAVTESGLPIPPPVAARVFSDALKTGTVFPAGVCRTGYTLGDLIPDGLELTVLGRCPADQETPSLTVPGRGLSIGDGDAAVDFKLTGAPGRARVSMYVRERDGKLMIASLNFATNQATLVKRDGSNNATVASHDGLRDLANPTDWNRLALRVQGGEAWLLLNDEPILYADDVVDQVGGIGLGLLREGNPDDEEECVVVFRDFTLSALPDTDPARAPAHT